MELITLDSLAEGERLCVTNVNSTTSVRRLNDLGISKDTKIQKIFSPPWKDPSAYMLKGTVIALRKETANKICGFKISGNGV
jgi:ferrous iron transport protein A